MPSSSSVESKTSAHPAPAEQPHPNRHLTTRHRTGFKPITTEEDGRIEDDIRAMDAEAHHLRWSSRVDFPDSSSSTSTSVTFNLGQRARSKSRSRIIKDSIQAMPFNNSSHIERNKQLREDAMNAIVATNRNDAQAETSHSGECEPNMANDYHWRRSSISGRGKRISTSFDVDVIPQPQHSVSSSNFYKHIDANLPDSERLRILLIWCASRAAANSMSPSKPNSTTSNNGKESSGDKDNRPSEPELPPLSACAQEVLKNIQEDVIRMLAERKIDLSLYSGDDPSPDLGQKQLKPNEQNVTNRTLEIRYADHIKRAQEEEEAWNQVSYHYDAYIKRQKEFLAKRIARMTPSSTHAADDSQPTMPSAKANGKQHDTGMDDPWKSINIQDLPPDMKRGIAIAKALVASVQPKHPSASGKSPPQKQQRNSNTPLPMPTLPDGELDLIGQALDEEIERRMHHVDFKLDYLLSCAHAARAMVKTAEELLNRWFEILEHNLSSRVNIQPGAPSTSSNPSNLGGFLAKYVPRRLPPAGFVISRYEEEDDMPSATRVPSPPPPPPPTSGMDPRDLLRALSIIDCSRRGNSDRSTISAASVTKTAPASRAMETVMMPTQRAVIPAQHTDSTSIEGDGDDGYDADAELEDSDTNATRFSDQYGASVYDDDYDADAINGL